MHNTTEMDYKVLKENPLAQMIIYRVADLPVHHSTFLKENSKISIPIDIPEEYPNAIPPTPQKEKPLVPPKLSQFHSLELTKNAPRVLFRDTDESTSDSDGVLFQESPTPSSSGRCSDHSGGFSDFEPDVHLMNIAADTSMCRVTHSLTQQGLGNPLETFKDFLSN